VKAIEFFSGIGAFAEAVRNYEIDVVAAFDQNEAANETYAHNFSLQPCSRNLDSIKLSELPQADLWWMSPPCTPFSVRGKRKGLQDPRAASLRNLIEIAATTAMPQYILIENVVGFRNSDAANFVQRKLAPHGYDFVEFDLCSTQFGVPMRRRRYFLVAGRTFAGNGAIPAGSLMPPILSRESPGRSPLRLQEFITEDADGDLLVPEAVMERYEQGFDIVDVNDAEAQLICFTKNYERCMKASGSLLRTGKGIRRVSPEEILRLLGFSESFIFPREISRSLRWRLLGNSVDVRVIKFILESLGIAAKKTAGVER
jgi:site-specific DNA-cytosine methylase